MYGGRRRWMGVAIAVVFVAIIEALSDSLLDAQLPFPFDTVLVVLVVATVAGAGAWIAFGLIDRLTRDLVERNGELQARNDALRALYAVSVAVAGQADPNQTIGSIVEHARGLLHADAALLVLETPQGELRLSAVNAAPGVLMGAEPPPAIRGAGEPRGELTRFLRPGFEVLLQAPLVQGGRRIGALAVAAAKPRAFSAAEQETLSALATQAGIAFEAARLQDELQALAVQGERERIAREMHDGLAQVLGYVNTKSQAVEGLLEGGRVEEARRQLSELAEAARSVYVDVREAILSLSTPVPAERGLAAALEEYVARYAESSKLAAHFDATPEAIEAPLSQAIQVEAFRIASEALTNVRKHARAQRVAVRLARDGPDAVLSVVDDGRGFEPDLVGTGPENWPHFGLAGMRERAKSVGGRIVWRSRPGAGTEVELRVPVAREVPPAGPVLPSEDPTSHLPGQQAAHGSVHSGSGAH